jgi:hypothetical protein
VTDGKTIEFASRALKLFQRNWAQIEKENGPAKSSKVCEKPISQHLIGYRNHRTTAVDINRRKTKNSQTNPTIQNIKWISKN